MMFHASHYTSYFSPSYTSSYEVTSYPSVLYDNYVRRNGWILLYFITIVFLVGCFIRMICKWKQTRWMLESRGLPTIYWRPRFSTYQPFQEDKKKLSSTTITRILPRMQRLDGPFGMYGTVYGISTPVVHIAHPVPARAVLGKRGMATAAATAATPPTRPRRRRSSISETTGACKAPAYDHFKNFCGNGVFTADGEVWKTKRTCVMHCLIKGVNSSSSEISQILERQANEAADAFCKQIETKNETTSTKTGQQQQQQQQEQTDTKDDKRDNHNSNVHDIVPLLQRATLGFIYKYLTHDENGWDTMFEESMQQQKPTKGAKKKKKRRIQKNNIRSCPKGSTGSGWADSIQLQPYLDASVRIRMILLAQSRSIWFLLPRWCYRLLSSLYRDEETTLISVRKFASMACQKAYPDSPIGKLRSMYDDNTKNVHIKDHALSTNIMDEAITLLFAGQDTSAATLSWTIHMLSLHPTIQEKLAAEVSSVLLDKYRHSTTNGRDDLTNVTKDDISKMPYLDAVIKESMRLHPVAPFVVRRLMDDIHIVGTDGKKKENKQEDVKNSSTTTTTTTTVLPKNAIACIWIYGLHRNPLFWNRPDDFYPERWLNMGDENDDDDDDDNNDHTKMKGLKKDVGPKVGAYMPFAAGPRDCIGQPIANIVIRTILAKLIFRYEFQDERLTSSMKMSSSSTTSSSSSLSILEKSKETTQQEQRQPQLTKIDPLDLRKSMQAGFTVLPDGGVHVRVNTRVHGRKEKI